jgi:outer membrane protein assembly factor BamA
MVAEGPLYNLRSLRILYTTPSALAQFRAEVLKDPRATVEYLTADEMLKINRRAFSDAQAAGLVYLKPGDVYSEDKLRKSLDAIRQAYGKLGYVLDTARGPVTAQVEPKEVRDDKSPQVDLLLFVREGEPYTTGEIIVRGDDLTKQQVILRQMQVKPDRPLDNEALEDSRKRLEALRLFEPGSVRITVQPEDPDRPGIRDVLTEVRETNTGEFNFGAAIASDSGVIGRIGIVQRNFDVADVPDSWGELFSGRAFRGAGQTFDIEVLPGTEQSVFSVSLSDPYFLETNYSAGAAASYRVREYDQYDQRTYGGRLTLGRRFGAVWQGSTFLRADNVKLYHIEDDAPQDDFDDAGPNTLVGLGFELVRTTTDDRFRPSRGSRVGMGIEQVGVDFSFTKLDYQYTSFFAINESFLGYKTVLKLQNNAGYIPQGQDEVPVYERYYLGGQNFRGFAYRTISPKGIRHDTMTQGDDPVGGVFSFFLGAEINQPVYKDIFSMVFFVDTGTVDTDVTFEHYRVSVGIGARFYIKGLSPLPIALDFGFPVIKQDGDESRLFTFSIDLPYN